MRWLIGTTFAWHDVACYVAGTAFAFLADRAVLRPAAPPDPELASPAAGNLPPAGGVNY